MFNRDFASKEVLKKEKDKGGEMKKRKEKIKTNKSKVLKKEGR
jgi:hypothetical protein